LHFLRHWVRETGTFTLEEGVRRLTSDPAAKYRIPDRGRIAPGAWADLLLFDPATVGMSALERRRDLPAGGARMIPAAGRRPRRMGEWRTDSRRQGLLPLESGPGQVLTKFLQ